MTTLHRWIAYLLIVTPLTTPSHLKVVSDPESKLSRLGLTGVYDNNFAYNAAILWGNFYHNSSASLTKESNNSVIKIDHLKSCLLNRRSTIIYSGQKFFLLSSRDIHKLVMDNYIYYDTSDLSSPRFVRDVERYFSDGSYEFLLGRARSYGNFKISGNIVALTNSSGNEHECRTIYSSISGNYIVMNENSLINSVLVSK